MKRETRNLLLIAVAAALVGGVAAFIVEGPGPLLRTEAGQRALNAVIQRDAPEGLAIAKRGEPMPRPQVWTLEGKRIDLPIAKGRPMLINVWATWCGPCIKEMPELAEFSHSQGARGVQVIGLALDDVDAVKAWLARLPSPYAHYRDDAGPRDAGVVLGNPAGVLPYTILIDADGVVRKQQVGPFASAADIADWSGTDAN
ncbi:TlpA family protein disulfide reductase [Solilutibacter tolerans]|uniref:Thiol-disulfide isomerase or thioredoxin n=1 Tax=Solilutibacter tolerans TaxID=1604334 RepID=A0A1N6Y354_9GAMM|nr:TlpA disulfide reductase family protein [Lysobacter tolerans]SIR08941.1 Thiol-disulfide isomerase or thioredoxin [Lysobacter tolerans]